MASSNFLSTLESLLPAGEDQTSPALAKDTFIANTFYSKNNRIKMNYSDRKVPSRSVRSRKRHQTFPIHSPNACPNER